MEDKISRREEKNMEQARALAREGMVLLENRNRTLPLEGAGQVCLFGSGARRTAKGGTGSGDVNARKTVSVEDGLLQAGLVLTSQDWLDRYDALCSEAEKKWQQELQEHMKKENLSWVQAYFRYPYHDPDELPITQEDLSGTDTDIAIYVIKRTSGEGRDRTPLAGDYELTPMEKKNLAVLGKNFRRVVVVLNVCGVIDTKAIRETPGIGAVLLMSLAGCEGGNALADILLGKVSPSGHLAATWAENFRDYPCSRAYTGSGAGLSDEYYNEDIYVGYRYFDTFRVNPAYPFGYGLSYTKFAVEYDRTIVRDGAVTVRVNVTNTGSYAGRYTAQVYVSAPKGTIEKPFQVLAGFEKTPVLAPRESCELRIALSLPLCASYDPKRAVYILEKGEYFLRLGDSSRSTHVVSCLVLEHDVIVRRVKNLLGGDSSMHLLSSEGFRPWTYDGEDEEKKNAPRLSVDDRDLICPDPVYAKEQGGEQKTSADHPITMEEVRSGAHSVRELLSQLSMEELASLCVGGAAGREMASQIGNAAQSVPGAAGETTWSLLADRHIPGIVMADGPAGLRLTRDYTENGEEKHQYCTALPVSTLLAQTFDRRALVTAGNIVGEEMEEYGVDLWLAPGMNIQRGPLCGRNFEYFSEDPFLSGTLAAGEVRGVQSHHGKGCTIKHFACNNVEDNREHLNAHVSERALREIYLAGFSICVMSASPRAVMSSYNLINGVHSANSRDLLTDILRNEWGYSGCVMTDWCATWGQNSGSQRYGASDPRGCIAAGNDLIMPGSGEDRKALLSGTLTKAELEECAANVLFLVWRSM